MQFVVLPVGVGKTHLAEALGHQACRQGHRVLFTKTSRLLSDLGGGHADGTWDGRLRAYLQPALLVIDDWAMREFTTQQADDLYELISERMRAGSMILTSNRAPQDWYALFPNPVLAESALDRLLGPLWPPQPFEAIRIGPPELDFAPGDGHGQRSESPLDAVIRVIGCQMGVKLVDRNVLYDARCGARARQRDKHLQARVRASSPPGQHRGSASLGSPALPWRRLRKCDRRMEQRAGDE